MGKKHHRDSRQASELSAEQLEKRAREDMAAGRYRKARDAYKILCKQDRDRNLPGLIEANRRLAEQLMENGRTSEAEQVLAYLKTIAPVSSILATDVSLALKTHDWQKALDGALRLSKDTATTHHERDRAAVADALVLAFPSLEEMGRLDLPEAADLAAVVGALHGVSEQRWEQAQELLRPVSRGSSFAAWKILIKGMIAFYAGDRKKAAALFAQLPPYGVPVRAAKAFGLLLGPGHRQEFNEPEAGQAARGACFLLNATNLAPFLMRADQSWRAARHADSYKEMREAPDFPSDQPDLAGALSDFYFKAPFAMRDAAYDKYLDWFGRIAQSNRFKNDREARLVYRLLGCVELDNPFSGGETERLWRSFLQFYPADDPLRAKMVSRVLEQVGHYYAEVQGALPFFFGQEDERPRDVQGAIRLLEESIEHDPSSLGPYLKLLDVYKAAEHQNDRTRLLDRMAQLFPKDKGVLLHAGRDSVKQKAYLKGIQYLERAHSLDALDPEILETLVSAYTRLTRQYYEKRNVIKGRHTFDLARRHAVRDNFDFIRGLDFMQAFQGVLEMTFGEKRMGLRLMTEARECTRSPVALLFYAHGNSRLYQRKQGSPYWAELKQNQARVGSARVRKEVYLTFQYLLSLDKALDWGAETAFVRKCLAPLAAEGFTRDEASYFVPILKEHPPFVSLAKAIIAQALRRDPDDPRFRLYSVLGRSRSPQELNIWEVDRIYHDALRQGDTETAKVAHAAIEAAESLLDSPFDDEDDFGFPTDEIDEMRRVAAQMSDAEFEKFRKDSVKMMPSALFDIVMSGVRQKPAPGTQPERGPGAHRRKDQPELFKDLFNP
jgi:tetratricopeptide (TPR) repeat protein